MGLEKREETKLLPSYGRKRIMILAEAYRELSNSFRDMEKEMPQKSMDRREFMYRKGLQENQKIMELRLKEMAERMEELAEESLNYSAPNSRKVRILKNGLAKHGILLKDIFLIRKKSGMQFVLTMRGQRNADYTAEDIAEILTEMFGMPLVSAKENLFFIAYEYDTYLFEYKGRYEFETGIATATKENEVISGDNSLVYDISGNQRVCLISDGAGSGEEACKDSERAIELLEKYMDIGFGLPEAADMVNSIFVSQGRDLNMPTLDACYIDLVEGKASFRKYGACDSFIKRGKKLERIKSQSYPLGFRLSPSSDDESEDIFEQISINDMSDCEYELGEDDYVLMFSDGVLECFSDEKALLKAFTGMEPATPREVANYLMQCAIRRCGGHIRDDMTILVGKLNASGGCT